jgi:hypothetical protein
VLLLLTPLVVCFLFRIVMRLFAEMNAKYAAAAAAAAEVSASDHSLKSVTARAAASVPLVELLLPYAQ